MLDVPNSRDLLHHPGQLLPSPTTLKEAYNTAVADIAHSRGRTVPKDGDARDEQERAFDAFLSAAANSCCAIVAAANPECSFARSNPLPSIPVVQVIASGPGSGKTTLAKAFAVALVRAERE